MSIVQPKRISYTRRDLLSFDGDVDNYIKEFIPRITDTSRMNTGRVYLSLIEALVDNLNYSVDRSFLESLMLKAKQRNNIITEAEAYGYHPSPVSAASVDVTISMLTGVAPVGGYPVPVYTALQTTSVPILDFFTASACTILEGETSIDVAAVQGTRVVDEVLSAASSGNPDQKYTLQNAKTPHIFIEVWVDGVRWDQVTDFMDSDEESQHYIVVFDEDDYSTIVFGDDEFGDSPGTGSLITATYIYTAADQGNVSKDSVKRIVGALASDLGVTNALAASGGGVSEINSSIIRNAPVVHRSIERAVTHSDYEALATQVSGVYKAFAVYSEGSLTNIYIMPDGGGAASTYLINLTQAALDDVKVEGALPIVYALNPASILISINIITFSNKVQKPTVKSKVRQETLDQLDYRNLIRGRGFTISDLSGFYENLDSGKLIDYIDFNVLSRVPRVQKTNVLSPDFVGRVKITATAGYDTYVITAVTVNQFVVSKNGTPQSVNGTVAVEFTTDSSEVSFTLGELGDVFTIGDSWSFKTSKYSDNIVLDDDEYMQLEDDGDLIISVYYPGEYNPITKGSVL